MTTPTRRAVLKTGTAWLCAAGLHREADAGPPQDDVIVPPRPVHQERPRYTKAGREARIEGELVLRAVVETDGTVHEVTVVKSLDAQHGLDEAGIAAARKWRFTPGTLKGKPIRVRVTIALDFTL